MMRSLRRLGIATGALVAASLVVGLVGGWFLPPSNLVATLVVVILGALIYRDIIRRDQPSV